MAEPLHARSNASETDDENRRKKERANERKNTNRRMKRTKTDRKSSQNVPISEPKRTPNRSRDALGRRRGARARLGALPGRSGDAPATLWGGSGALPDAPGTLQDAPGALPERSGDAPGLLRSVPGTSQTTRKGRSPRRSPFGSSADRFSTVFRVLRKRAQVCFDMPFGTPADRFSTVFRSLRERAEVRFASVLVWFHAHGACCVARVVRTRAGAFRVSFGVVSRARSTLRGTRGSNAKNVEKTPVAASKINLRSAPGAVRATQNELGRPSSSGKTQSDVPVRSNVQFFADRAQ